ncbi:28S ribosomal protein S31 isoform 1 [Schistosoma japonicum]|uniref:Small ribosomal subunit protein mS31 n=3 Tax=Schistosoma japonicum TaxID=6182 RepID=C1LLJ2_SCHJA|nr:mitochondrial ribosomal protein S31 [Schistosoma japonicum]KAH8863346.1 mitochondrial ribosomal protein S31 [Schistosoma japonicum]KAH8863347.1 mitochondrial ribosomal protein S31 [Schistosoma japonicum]KAH8863348.1 mitochondrial ribosomal protein S31 [Schistosoma japonicum]TNN16848.1 28S ribosomal protein S31 isoform 1 [Schistosoma japonicum]
MVTLYCSIFSKFHISFDYFKCLTVTPYKSLKTKASKQFTKKNHNPKPATKLQSLKGVSDNVDSTDIIKSKDLLWDFVKDREYLGNPSSTSSPFIDLPSPVNLKIFTDKHVAHADSCNSLNPVFDTVENLEASILSCASPNNQFEEWLKWTVEKKMWSFPINNEQDWDSESDVPFYEHVFLENHLNKDHLKCKPLASFLELVCNGLSQNPHYSVNDKKKHLEWFSKFFDDKISQINASVEEEEYMANLEKVSRGIST